MTAKKKTGIQYLANTSKCIKEVKGKRNSNKLKLNPKIRNLTYETEPQLMEQNLKNCHLNFEKFLKLDIFFKKVAKN